MRFIKKIGEVLFLLLPIALIAIDLLVISIPSWIVVTLLLIDIILVARQIISKKKKTRYNVILGVAEGAIVLITLFGIYCNPYYNSISFHNDSYISEKADRTYTYRQAKQDIDTIYRYLKKDHPIYIKGKPEEETRKDIERAYQQVLKELKSTDHITTITVWTELEKLLASLHDAHTTAYWCSEDKHYLKYYKEHEDVGDKLVKVNGVALEDLFASHKNYFSYELESLAMDKLNSCVISLEGLEFLGIDVSQGTTYTYENQGVEKDYSYTLDDYVTYDEYQKYNSEDDKKAKPDQSFVRYKLDKEASLGILTIDTCTINKVYRHTLNKFFAKVKQNNIKHVAVDLRENGGGNSLVINEFLRYLNIDKYYGGSSKWRLGFLYIPDSNKGIVNHKKDNLMYQGDVYILTSVNTFSSAMMYAEWIQDNHLGKIVGEIPGENPNGYGDVSIFKTPNAKIYAQISTKEFFRADSNNKDNCITPDYVCDSEKALDKIYEIIEGK
ncbi:S41 family peptidase [Anaeromicropila herbilytica]|uniref:Tail specific protease domain-containing protein n=1 Tax=Anaeromicropila herbilytica TaxID=2785025 RepID=A0A7R7EPZ3_9FIRM|nr:S41 family peptidase [Anaeromicropila herbilytica]BCN32585.1 hypothetical protein bsdtb5_38800 [Anaeromicropila herbilytica]